MRYVSWAKIKRLRLIRPTIDVEVKKKSVLVRLYAFLLCQLYRLKTFKVIRINFCIFKGRKLWKLKKTWWLCIPKFEFFKRAKMNKRRYHDNKPAWVRRFYNSMAWRRKRAYILRRDKHMCQHCKAKGKVTVANEVHHVKELEDYPELALEDENLISLCRPCHEKTKQFGKKMPDGVRIIKM